MTWLRMWLYRFFFGQAEEIVDLRARLTFSEEKNLALRAELVQKEAEVKALFDALLIGADRQPMYSAPVREEIEEVGTAEQLSNTLKHAKGRGWSNVAAAIEQQINLKANGGVTG